MTCCEEPIIGSQPTTPITDETHQHLSTFVIRTLRVEVVDELCHTSALVVRIKLKVNVVDEVPVTLPQGQVVALNLVIVERSNGRKLYDPVRFQRLDEPPHALRERFGVRFEVLVVDVDSVQVVLFDYGGE